MEKTRVSRTDGKSRLFIKAALCFILIFGLGMAMAQNLMATDYTQVMSFGSYGSDDGQFNTVIAIAVDSYGNIFIADAGNNRIQKFSSSGAYLGKFGTYGTGNGQFDSPSGIAFDSYGNVFVTDSNNNRIQKFSSSGTYLGKFGTYGTGNGQFNYPFGLAIDSSDNIYVTDNTRVQKLNSSGTYLSSYSSILKPSGVAVDNMGWIYVADFVYNNVKVFGSSGTLLYTIGTTGYGNGQFNSPKGVATDSSGNFLYVADTDNNRIQILSYNGTYIGQFSSGLYEPWGVALDSSGNVYVADSMNSKIKKFSSSAVSTYTISGYVYDSSYNYLSGVTMTTSSGDYTTTDYSGYYSLTVSSGWSGTVTPSKSGYTFYPTSNSYSSGTTSDQAHDYTAYGATYTISGKVYDSSTYYGISGVTVTTSSGGYTTTDYSGYYSFTVSPGWSGTITPSKSGYTFTPKTYSYLSSDLWWEDYYGSSNPTSYTISGSVYDSSYNYMSGVTMTLSTGGTTTTDSSGSYSFTVSSGWSGTVTPSKSGYSFSPVNQSYSYVYSDQYSQYFVGSIPPSGYTIYGSVYDSSYNYMSGVTMTLSTGGTTTTDSYGSYSFTVNSGWSGTITPSKSGYTFAPISNSYSYVTSNQYSPYFVGNPSGYTISGYVYDASTYAYLSDVTMTTSSGSTTTTDSSGNYSFTVSSDWSGTITPSKSGYTFSPSSKSYSSVSYNYSYETYSASYSGGTSFVTRTLPASYMPGTKLTVMLTATPPSGTLMYSVSDAPPYGCTVSNISHSGVYDSTNSMVKFGAFTDGTSRTLTYDVTPPSYDSGDKTFSGTASKDGTSSSIGGQTSISKGLNLHPADLDQNKRMIADEVTGYGAAWLRFATWTLPPNPIPMSYVSKAIWLWQNGEYYDIDSALGSPPSCWVNTTGTRSERDNSLIAVRTLPSKYTAGVAITVTISVSASTTGYIVEDTLPSGWTASGMTDGGQTASGVVRFAIMTPNNPAKTLTYQATPLSGTTGAKTFSGKVALDATEIPITGTSSISDTATQVVMGDVNGSGGSPDLADAILALQVLAGLNPSGIKVGADVNGDGRIGFEELGYILQKVAVLRPSGT